MFAYAVNRIIRGTPVFFAGIFLAALAISFWVNFMPYHFPGSIDAGSAIFGLFLFLAFAGELLLIYGRKIRIRGIWALGFMATFILSLLIWSRSRTGGDWCDPGSLLQGHAIWHLLDALCVYFIYRYYRSEEEGVVD
jgi:hypothetical protein